MTNTATPWSVRQDYSNLADKDFGASAPLSWQYRCWSSPCVSVQVLQSGGSCNFKEVSASEEPVGIPNFSK